MTSRVIRLWPHGACFWFPLVKPWIYLSSCASGLSTWQTDIYTDIFIALRDLRVSRCSRHIRQVYGRRSALELAIKVLHTPRRRRQLVSVKRPAYKIGLPLLNLPQRDIQPSLTKQSLPPRKKITPRIKPRSITLAADRGAYFCTLMVLMRQLKKGKLLLADGEFLKKSLGLIRSFLLKMSSDFLTGKFLRHSSRTCRRPC